MNSRAKVIDYSKNKEFLCMWDDAKLFFNLIDQKKRGYYKDTDYIQPGLLSGQTFGEILRITQESIKNHLDNFNKKNILLL